MYKLAASTYKLYLGKPMQKMKSILFFLLFLNFIFYGSCKESLHSAY